MNNSKGALPLGGRTERGMNSISVRSKKGLVKEKPLKIALHDPGKDLSPLFVKEGLHHAGRSPKADKKKREAGGNYLQRATTHRKGRHCQ